MSSALQFFMNGGFPMFVILVFGLVGAVSAARYAWAPGPGRLSYLGALAVVIGLAGATGFATDLMAVCTQVPNHPEWTEGSSLGMVLVEGLGESLSPVVFAGGFLLAHGLLVALGLKRLAL